MALFVRSFLCFRKFIAFGGQHVVHMHRFLVENRASRGPGTIDQPFGRIYRYGAVMRPNLKLVTILEAYDGIIGIAKFASTLGNGLENRLDVGGRRGDHPQNVAAPGLVSQRFRKVAGLRLDLIEQSDIFDRDRCLVGKSRDQFDLLLGKRTRLRARQGDYADRNALAQHRNGEHSAETTQSLRFGKGVVGVCLNVGNVNHGPFQQSPPDGRASVRYNGNGSDKVHEFVRKPVRLGTKKHAVFLAGDDGLVGLAKPGRRFDQRLQYGLQVESRAADSLQHIGCRGLLLQRFGQIVRTLVQFLKQAGVLNSYDGLSSKVRDQLDLLVGEGRDFLWENADRTDQLALLEHRHVQQTARAPKFGG